MTYAGFEDRIFITTLVEELQDSIISLGWQSTDPSQANYVVVYEAYPQEISTIAKNGVALYIADTTGTTPIELGNNFLRRKTIVVEIAIASEEKSLNDDLASTIISWLESISPFNLMDEEIFIGTAELRGLPRNIPVSPSGFTSKPGLSWRLITSSWILEGEFGELVS